MRRSTLCYVARDGFIIASIERDTWTLIPPYNAYDFIITFSRQQNAPPISPLWIERQKDLSLMM